MKRISFAITIALLAFLSLIGCNHETKFEYYPGSTQVMVKYVINSESGKPDGDFQSFYEDGQLQNEGTMKEGVKNGTFKTYYKDGTLKEKGTFKMGTLVGKWESYYKDGSIEWKKNYNDDGKYDKEFKHFTADGTVDIDYYFKDGIPDGKFIATLNPYNSNDEVFTRPDEVVSWGGTYSAEGTLKNGKLDGTITKKYENRIIESEYNEGKLNGKKTIYNSQGKIFIQINYDNGTANGELITTTDDEYDRFESLVCNPLKEQCSGKNYTKANIKNGELDGKATVYEDESEKNISREYFYRNGTLIGANFYKNGKLVGFLGTEEEVGRKANEFKGQGKKVSIQEKFRSDLMLLEIQ